MDKTTLIKELTELLTRHDWHYAYSDDHSVYMSGKKHEKRILELAVQLPQPEIDALWEKHAPENALRPISKAVIQENLPKLVQKPFPVVIEHKNKTYAGIGSRETPLEILRLMEKISFVLAQHGWRLRSGHAPGADQAFETGASLSSKNPNNMEIYLPWRGFENAQTSDPRYVIPSEDCLDTYQEAMRVAAQFHPAWGNCSDGARKLHTRNTYQIAGKDLNSACNMVICWTRGGARGGGTGQPLRMAEFLQIPIFDLAVCTEKHIQEYINYGVLPG